MVHKKVPPGFNALVSARVHAAVEIVRRSVVPVYRVDAMGEPEHEGSGVLLRYRDRFFFASAAHVFEGLTEGVHLLIDGMSQHAVRGIPRVSIKPIGKPRTEDLVDLGFVKLTNSEAEGLGKANFLAVAASDGFVRHWSQRLVVVGLPGKLQWKDRAAATYHVQHRFYQAPEISEGRYSAAGLERGRHAALTFDHRRIQGPRGRGGRPNMAGMSGGGIWLLNPYDEYSQESPPPLVGLLAGTAPRNRKALFGSSVTTLCTLLEETLDSE